VRRSIRIVGGGEYIVSLDICCSEMILLHSGNTETVAARALVCIVVTDSVRGCQVNLG